MANQELKKERYDKYNCLIRYPKDEREQAFLRLEGREFHSLGAE